MRIAMLSCNTGEGHNSTAKAICDVLAARGVQYELYDVLACLSPKFSKFICNWHARLYKYAPKLWDVGYRMVEKTEQITGDKDMMAEILRHGSKKLRVILEEGQYDAVICPHVYSAMMMTELRRTWRSDIPSYFVATDYTRYPYIECCEMDGYFIPAPGLVADYEKCGLPMQRLIPCGIPVRQDFYSTQEKKQARAALQLPEEGLLVLLMCGSMGCGPMKKMAKELSSRLPEGALTVAFCGKNEKLLEELSAVEGPALRVLGFTDRVSTYMDAADMMITKPGGLSATEAANKRLPAVFINAIGGCENYNFNFFLERGYALGSTEPEEAVELAIQLANDPQRRGQMKQAMGNDFICNSACTIVDTVMAAVEQKDLCSV